jgi:hypothetical protein
MLGTALTQPTEPTCCYCGCGPRFSCLPISFFVFFSIAILISFTLSFSVGLLVYLPLITILYFAYVKRLRPLLLETAQPGFPSFLPHNLDDLFARMAASGYVLGGLLLLGLALLPRLIFFAICFGGTSLEALVEATGTEANDARGLSMLPGWVPFVFLTSFFNDGFLGELSKYLLVTCGCCLSCCAQVADPRPRQHALRTITILLAVGLGIAASQGFSLGMAVFASGRLHAVVRLLLTAPLHCITAAFTGLRLSVQGQQARQRDLDALAAGADGGDQFVLLSSGATVRVAAPVAAHASGAPPAAPQRQVVLWSWARVLWPAVAISGIFHFVVQVIDDGASGGPSPGATAGAALCAVAILAAAAGALWLQFRAVFDVICAGGRIPERLTMAPVWLPARAREWWLQRGGAVEVYNANEEGYLPLSAGPPPEAPAWAAAGAPMPPPEAPAWAAAGAPMQPPEAPAWAAAGAPMQPPEAPAAPPPAWAAVSRMPPPPGVWVGDQGDK